MKNTYKRLSFGFGLSLLILLISSIASYISINSLLNSSIEVAKTHAFIKELDNVISIIIDAETGQRGYLLTGDASFLDPYRGASQKAVAAMEKIRSAVTDMPNQQKNFDRLEVFLNERLNILRDLIDKKRAGSPILLVDLRTGKGHMDEVRRLVNLMESGAQNALTRRTDTLNEFAVYTRLIIVIASLLALLITVIFYLRVKKDFDQKLKLQNEMIEKDRSINARIKMIHDIAKEISLGNYQIRINNEDKDTLGSLGISLNKMTASLEHSFGLLSEREWLQTGASELNENMMGSNDLKKLCSNIINYVTEYTGSQIGSIYILEDDVLLKLYSGYGLPYEDSKKIFSLGEGTTGQCALDGKTHLLEDIEDGRFVINHASGYIKPKNIISFALRNEDAVKGVIELAKITPFSKKELAFIELVSARIAGVINRVQNRGKMQELLEETQSQTEELHVQHAELQNLNAEMEAKTQKLQSSDEELRVQQQELLMANAELKERTYLLEEKNQMIQERNIEIQRKAEELALSTKYKSEFLANMSHELRTPLNSILLLSGLMVTNTEKTLGADYVEYAKVIQSSGNGLLTLIDEILDLSKVESGKMQLEFTHIKVSEIAQNLESLFKPFASQKDIKLTVSIQPDVPSTIETDQMRLDQVLKNLLSNAIKFTPVNGKVDLAISMAPKDAHFIAFSVKDTGIGIAPDKQGLVFEAFQQEDGSTRRKFGGTGLGLSISRELIKLLNGKIDLHSEVGKGSEFIAYVPVELIDINDSGEETVPLSGVRNKLTPEPGDPLKKELVAAEDLLQNKVDDDRTNVSYGDRLLLIIEDDINFAKILLDFTKTNGYKALVATSGNEGLELAKKFKPTGILMDLKLPGINGWEVMELLKHDVGTMHIPVHIMSANKFQKESLLKGADDFINKPVAFDKIKRLFDKLDDSNSTKKKKVLIVEDNSRHAVALAYFLTTSKINTKIKHDLAEGIYSLVSEDIDCVILDKLESEDNPYKKLEEVRKTSGLETLPIVVFTSKNLTKKEEQELAKHADSIIIKTASSYQRILDEVSLFLHVVDREKAVASTGDQCGKLGLLNDVLQNKTIMIADDDVRNIFSLTKALERYKMNVITSMDGREVLNKLDENPNVDIILMDMMMPEMDGYDATAQIKQNPELQKIPVIAVTAKAMIGDREKCIEAGASDYITKPVDVDQLLSLLRVWLYEGQFQKN